MGKMIGYSLIDSPGVHIWPIVSLILFMVLFIWLIIWAVKREKGYIREMENMPLEASDVLQNENIETLNK